MEYWHRYNGLRVVYGMAGQKVRQMFHQLHVKSYRTPLPATIVIAIGIVVLAISCHCSPRQYYPATLIISVFALSNFSQTKLAWTNSASGKCWWTRSFWSIGLVLCYVQYFLD